jgi:excisionase family DNA binding protein
MEGASMNTTNETNAATSDDAEAALFERYKVLVDEVRATTNLDRVKAELYERMRARTPAPVKPVKEKAERTSSGPRPLSEVGFLTVAEVAAMMRVSKMTVYRLVHSGELPAIRTGRSFRVPEQAVHDYLRDAYDNWQVHY